MLGTIAASAGSDWIDRFDSWYRGGDAVAGFPAACMVDATRDGAAAIDWFWASWELGWQGEVEENRFHVWRRVVVDFGSMMVVFRDEGYFRTEVA